MILVVDCQDSFVETLARYVREAGFETLLRSHDRLSLNDVEALAPRGVILSPGPYTPAEAPLAKALPLRFPGLPILGVCLGHLAIAEAYGGVTKRAALPVHGRATGLRHEGGALFEGVPARFQAGRYHALVSDIQGTELVPTALSAEGELMAFRHKERPHFGVQFHPESVLTPDGRTMLRNFLQRTA
jgi:anthranilate synthase/aminodeoxychorismate synthase-like glutamine amidotransferase